MRLIKTKCLTDFRHSTLRRGISARAGWVLALPLLLGAPLGCTWYDSSDVPCFGDHQCPSELKCAQENEGEAGLCWSDSAPTPWCAEDHSPCLQGSDCCSLECPSLLGTCVTPCVSDSDCPNSWTVGGPDCCAIVYGPSESVPSGVCHELGEDLYCGSYN